MRPFVLCCSLLVAGVLGAVVARADIYTWTDEKGVVNVSNLKPPAGTNVTHITLEPPQAPAARNDAVREAARQAELQALNERVRELESAAAAAVAPRTTAATVVAPVYIPMPTPVVVSYAPEVTPPVVVPACDPTWLGCISSSTYYLPHVIVVPATPRRSPLLPKPINGPVVWPSGNVAALGPWASNLPPKQPLRPHHPH